MRTIRLAIAGLLLFTLPGCALKFVKVPDSVSSLNGEIVAVQMRGVPGKINRNVKIPLRSLRKIAGDFKEVKLLQYDPTGNQLVKHRMEGENIIADLVSGQTYLVAAQLGGVYKRTYDVLCRLEMEVGIVYLGPWVDRICPIILCLPEIAPAEMIFENIPELDPFRDNLNLDDIQIGGWGEVENNVDSGGVKIREGRVTINNVCPRCERYRGAIFTGFNNLVYCPPFKPEPELEIAFVSNRDGNSEIYAMKADGSFEKNLTNNPSGDFWPRWSPDGKKIAFVSYRNGNGDIYLMDPDGSNQTRLTFHDANDTKHAWSPDGQKILFISNRTGSYQIYKLVKSGTGWSSPQLVNAKLPPNYDYTWNPEGTTIAVSAWQTGMVNVGQTDIYSMDEFGGGWTNLTQTQNDFEGDTAWTPGSQIVFTSTRSGSFQIFKMKPDGTGSVNLSNNPGFEVSPIWSSNGQKIAFKTHRDGNWEVYVMDGDGSNQENLSNNSANDGAGIEAFLTWSPDSTEIAFQSNRDGNWEIYKVNIHSKVIKRLTNAAADDHFPQWRP